MDLQDRTRIIGVLNSQPNNLQGAAFERHSLQEAHVFSDKNAVLVNDDSWSYVSVWLVYTYIMVNKATFLLILKVYINTYFVLNYLESKSLLFI